MDVLPRYFYKDKTWKSALKIASIVKLQTYTLRTYNPCTQMAIRFSAEMEIESNNYNITIFIYSKIEKKKFNTNVSLFIFFIQITRK